MYEDEDCLFHFDMYGDDFDANGMDDDYLEHYGIPGMKWGVRKARRARAHIGSRLHARRGRAIEKWGSGELSKRQSRAVDKYAKTSRYLHATRGRGKSPDESATDKYERMLQARDANNRVKRRKRWKKRRDSFREGMKKRRDSFREGMKKGNRKAYLKGLGGSAKARAKARAGKIANSRAGRLASSGASRVAKSRAGQFAGRMANKGYNRGVSAYNTQWNKRNMRKIQKAHATDNEKMMEKYGKRMQPMVGGHNTTELRRQIRREKAKAARDSINGAIKRRRRRGKHRA